MKHLVPIALTLFLGTAAQPSGAGPAAPSLTQDRGDGEEVPDERDEVKELIDLFEDHCKEKGEEDKEAVAVVDLLMTEFEVSGPKDRASIVKALEKGFSLKRKDHEDGTPEDMVAQAAAVALGHMGPESVKPLAKAVGDKKIRKNQPLHRRIILALGKTAHEDAVDTLVKHMSDKEPGVQGAAIEALGEFRGLEQQDRKDIVEQLLKLILPIKSTVDTDSQDLVTRERYDVIGPPTITTLQRLTDQSLRDFNEWQTWWNKHKRDDWDEEG